MRAQPGLNLADVERMRVVVPPLPEQKKIAAVLSSVDEVIQATQAVIEQTRRVKEGLLQDLLTRGSGHTRFKQTEIGEIPVEWEVVTLSELATYRRGSFPQPYGLEKWYDDVNGHPFIQVFDVGGDMRVKETTKRRISALAAKRSVFVEKGSLILTLQGSIGRIADKRFRSSNGW